MRRFLLASLSLHCALALVFFARWQRPADETVPEAVLVELTEPASGPARANASPPPGAAPATTPASRSGRALPFSAFAPRAGTAFAPVRPGETPTAHAPGVGSPYAASDEVFTAKNERAQGALGWVYRKAHLSLGYPREFIRHEITGKVQAELAFDSQGAFLPALLTVRATNPYLRVYVYRLLEQTFRGSFVPAGYRKWAGQLDVLAFVEFSFVNDEAQVTVSSSHPIVGNKLFFERQSVQNAARKLEWSAGPLHGVLPVPVVGVNMLWFAKRFEKEKAPVDDLEPYRRDPLFYD